MNKANQKTNAPAILTILASAACFPPAIMWIFVLLSKTGLQPDFPQRCCCCAGGFGALIIFTLCPLTGAALAIAAMYTARHSGGRASTASVVTASAAVAFLALSLWALFFF